MQFNATIVIDRVEGNKVLKKNFFTGTPIYFL
jgi:hypothetical protein